MMEDEDVALLIRRVSDAYSQRTGDSISEALGAFIIRAIVLEHPSLFNLSKQLSESDVQQLVRVRDRSSYSRLWFFGVTDEEFSVG
jgi:hypothetical protein